MMITIMTHLTGITTGGTTRMVNSHMEVMPDGSTTPTRTGLEKTDPGTSHGTGLSSNMGTGPGIREAVPVTSTLMSTGRHTGDSLPTVNGTGQLHSGTTIMQLPRCRTTIMQLPRCHNTSPRGIRTGCLQPGGLSLHTCMVMQSQALTAQHHTMREDNPTQPPH